MDSAWIGAISALAGAIVGGGISFLLDWRSGKRQEVRDEAQRRHEVEERRFDTRREAYVDFGSAVRGTVLASLRYEKDHGGLPGEFDVELTHPQVDDALAMLQIIGPAELVEVAERTARCLLDWSFGPPGVSLTDDEADVPAHTTHADVQAAISAYTELARSTLKLGELA